MNDIHLDFERNDRQGFYETVFGQGKTVEQLEAIGKSFYERSVPLFITRLTKDKFENWSPVFSSGKSEYNEEASCFIWRPDGQEMQKVSGLVNVICAGSSDIPVLSEAECTLKFYGVECVRIGDVGVAGIHRLLAHEDQLNKARVNIVVAGMEGALPSVVGGLVGTPVIAVPTSVGYGANFSGLSALLTMINSCASGITVVNIDNGFGAAMAALRILLSDQS